MKAKATTTLPQRIMWLTTVYGGRGSRGGGREKGRKKEREGGEISGKGKECRSRWGAEHEKRD